MGVCRVTTKTKGPVFWLLYVTLIVGACAAFFFATRAFATDKPVIEPPQQQTQTQAQSQNQSQTQNQSQANAQTVTNAAGGGQGGGASNQLAIEGDRTTAIGLSTTAPIPLAVEGAVLPACWLPTRSRSYVFGIYAASSNYKRDEKCMRDLEAQRAHELALVEAQHTDRVVTCSDVVSRGVAACASK